MSDNTTATATATATMIQITVISANGSGESHSMEISSSSTLHEAMEWAMMYLGISSPSKPEDFVFCKDGIIIANVIAVNAVNAVNATQQTLLEAGVQHGDLLAVQPVKRRPITSAAGSGSGSGSGSGTVSGTVRTASASASAATTTGLDFSSLLAAGNNNSGAADYAAAAAAVAAGGGLNFSNFLGSAAAAGGTGSSGYPAPVYYPGMSLDDAMMHNRHPRSFVEVLFGNNENNKNNESSLVKELNYHQPLLAAKLRASVQKNRNNNNDLTEATTIWRDELTKGSIRGAMAQTDRRMTEQSMTQKLNDDPGSQEAKDYFQQQKNQSLIAEQYRNAMDEFPESMGKILMLYIDTVVNGHAVQAFVDSGAQSTIMTKQTAALCGIDHLIDTRFAGQAVGVGTGIILGRIHLAQMKIGQAFFPITITVMEKMSSHNDMKFLLGLDNLKRFTCAIDLEQNVLRFKIGQEYMTTPFLHEKDLGEDKGGTQGFDAEKANQELMELRQKRAAADDDDGNRRKKKDDDEPMEE